MNWPRLLPTALAAFDSDNPSTDRDLHVLAGGFFALRLESSSSLPPVVFVGFCAFSLLFLYFPFSLYLGQLG